MKYHFKGLYSYLSAAKRDAAIKIYVYIAFELKIRHISINAFEETTEKQQVKKKYGSQHEQSLFAKEKNPIHQQEQN